MKLKESNQLSVYARVQLENKLVRPCDAQGKADRIKSTIFPATYRLFLHGFIYLVVVSLSIALNNAAGIYEMLTLLLICTLFLLFEEPATQMQDPFEHRAIDTAITTIARTMEKNIKQLIKESTIPQPLKAENFYLL